MRCSVWFFLALLLASLPTIACAETSAAHDQRPNIAFAFADDWGRYASAYREPSRATLNDAFETPHFDALAKNGLLFWDAHVSAPSCTPSRTAVLTGRHFFRNGSGSQLHSPWFGDPADDPVKRLESYHTLLDKAGYHTGVTHKTHVSMHLFVDGRHGYGRAGGEVNRFSQFCSRFETEAERRSAKQQLLDEVRGNLQDFLAAGDEGQPFCWYYSPVNPHRPWVKGSAQKLWGIDPDDLRGKLPQFLPDNEVLRQDMADYLGECRAFDEQVGVIVDELKTRGLLDNTILVVSGDHGAPGFPRGKTNLLNFGTQVPLLIHWPAGLAAPGRVINNPTSLIDLAPTFLDAAGVPAPSTMDGESLLPVLKEPTAHGHIGGIGEPVITGREVHFNCRPGNLPYPSRAIRTADYLYIRNFEPDRWPQFVPPLTSGPQTHGDFDGGPTKQWYAEVQEDPAYAPYVDWAWGKRPSEELYDLREDVDQMNNLATSPQHQDVKQSLSEQLMAVLIAGKDPRVDGEGDAFDRPPYCEAIP